MGFVLRIFSLFIFVLGVFIESIVDFLDILWSMMAMKHGIGPKDVLLNFIGL